MASNQTHLERLLMGMRNQPQPEPRFRLVYLVPQPMQPGYQQENQQLPAGHQVRFMYDQPLQNMSLVQQGDRYQAVEPDDQFVDYFEERFENQPQGEKSDDPFKEVPEEQLEGQPHVEEYDDQFEEEPEEQLEDQLQGEESNDPFVEEHEEHLEDQPQGEESDDPFMEEPEERLEDQPPGEEPDEQFEEEPEELLEDQPQGEESDDPSVEEPEERLEDQPQGEEPDDQFEEEPEERLADQPQEVEPELQLEDQPLDIAKQPFLTSAPPEVYIMVESEFLLLLAVLQADSVCPESRDRNCATAIHFGRRYGVPVVYRYLESRNHQWIDGLGCRCLEVFPEITRGCQEAATRFKIPQQGLHEIVARLHESVDLLTNRDNCVYLLHIGLRYCVESVVLYLLGRGVDTLYSCDAQLNCSALFHAIESGSIVFLQMVLSSDIDIGRRYGNDWGTALHVAVDKGFIACVKTLLAVGFDPNARDAKRRTPLHLAAQKNACEIAKELIGAGCNVELRDHTGYTALHAGLQNIQMTWLLILEGADVNVRTEVGENALLIAAGSVSTDAEKIVRLLVKRNADIFARDDLGKSVLHRALCVSMVECLVELGANLNAVDDKGQTPLHMACQFRRFGVVFALIEFGARADIVDNQGRYFDDELRCANEASACNCKLLEIYCKFTSRSIMFGVIFGQTYFARAIGCCRLYRFKLQSKLELETIEFKVLGTHKLGHICFRRISDPGFVMHPEVCSFFEDKNLPMIFPNYHTHLQRIYKMAVWRNNIMSDPGFLDIFSLVVLGRKGLSVEIARMILKYLSLSDLVSLKFAYNYQ